MEDVCLYRTTYAGLKVGVFDDGTSRFKVKYIDEDHPGTFSGDYGSNGVEDVLTRFIKGLFS